MLKSEFEIDNILEILRHKFVTTHRDAEVRHEIDRLLRRDADGAPIAVPVRFSGGREARGIVVTGHPGDGKSTIIDHVLKTHPALGLGAPGGPRYLAVTVPSPATLKALGCEILRVSGYPDVSERRERWSIWRLVRHRLAALGVVVLLIDEAHDLRSNGSVEEIMDILCAFKSLLEADPPVILLLSGIPILHEIVAFEGQKNRRFAKLELSPVTAPTEGDKLQQLIVDFCRCADIAPPEVDVVPRLIYASRYRFGMCIENTLNAIEEALRHGDDRLTLAHFAEAWAAVESKGPDCNPFLAIKWASIDLTEGTDPRQWKLKK